MLTKRIPLPPPHLPAVIRKTPGIRFDDDGRATPVDDALVVEGALEIRVNGEPFTVTMRTPGEDRFLARGLLHTERIVARPDAEIAWEEARDPASGLVRRLDARVADADVAHDALGRRALLATASCGLCGAREASDIELIGAPLARPDGEILAPARIAPMMTAMRAAQETFEHSGGSHAAAAFTLDGERLAQSEDIGRHNAVDKVVGRLLLEGGAPALARARCLTVSGRLSFEIVAKAYRAGIPFVLAVSAPSALAAAMGERLGLTIVGFCRGTRATVYSHPDRLRG